MQNASKWDKYKESKWSKYKVEEVEQQPTSQPKSFTEQRFPLGVQGIQQAKSGNPVAGGLNLANQAVSEGFRPVEILNQFLRNNKTINPDIFPAGKASSNVMMAIPEAISGAYDLVKSGINATGLPQKLNEIMPIDESGETSQALETMNKNIAMVTMPQVASKIPLKPSSLGRKIQQVAKKFETKAITPPFLEKKGFEVFDREVNTALKDNYSPTRKGLEKLENNLNKLNEQSSQISTESAKRGNVIDFNETKSILEKELQKADRSSASFDEISKAVADVQSRIDRIGNKYDGGQVPIDIANELKGSFQEMANGKYDQSVAPSQANINLYKKVGHKLLNQIIQQEPMLRKVGLAQRNLIELKPILGRKISATEKASIINWQNLTKAGVATSVGAMTNPLVGLAMFGAEQALSKPSLLHPQAVALDRLGTFLNPQKYAEGIKPSDYPINPSSVSSPNLTPMQIKYLMSKKNRK